MLLVEKIQAVYQEAESACFDPSIPTSLGLPDQQPAYSAFYHLCCFYLRVVVFLDCCFSCIVFLDVDVVLDFFQKPWVLSVLPLWQCFGMINQPRVDSWRTAFAEKINTWERSGQCFFHVYPPHGMFLGKSKCCAKVIKWFCWSSWSTTFIPSAHQGYKGDSGNTIVVWETYYNIL